MPALLRDPDDDPPDGKAAEASEGAVPAPPPRERAVRGDWVYLVAAGVGAAALQSAGWRVGAPERGLLVRLVALAAGLALVGAAAQIALARHASRRALSRSERLRRSMVSVVVLALLGASGLLLWLRS
jgi:uncharacterized membrane protein